MFSSLLVPMLLDDVGCEQALLLVIARRKQKRTENAGRLEKERKERVEGREKLRRPTPPSLGSLPKPIALTETQTPDIQSSQPTLAVTSDVSF